MTWEQDNTAMYVAKSFARKGESMNEAVAAMNAWFDQSAPADLPDKYRQQVEGVRTRATEILRATWTK